MKRPLSYLVGFFLRFSPIGSIFLGAVLNAHAANWALAFNGLGRGVTVTNSLAFNSLPLTVTFWVQTTQSVAAVSGLATKSIDPAALNGWQVFLTNGQVRASYCVSPVRNAGGPNGLAGSPIADGRWHYVAFVADTNSVRLQVDGSLPVSALWTGLPGPTLTTNDVHLGGFAPPAISTPFLGAMDEITVWNVALTPVQISANTNFTLTGNEPGLIAYYRCNEGAGLTLFDSAPAAGTNNGTLGPSVTYIPSTIGSNTPAGPTVQTLGANVGVTTALLIGSMNAMGTNTAGWFQWGTTTNYGNSTGAYLDSGTSDVQFYIGIDNLSGGTIYHFRAVASNSVGMAFGNDLTFTLPVFGDILAGLPGVYQSSVGWVDYDNDGKLDCFFSGIGTNYNLPSPLWRNTGNGFTNSNAYPGSDSGLGNRDAWGDFNNDGQVDLLDSLTGLWLNSGGNFTNIITTLPSLNYGSTAWGDYDNDGRPDALLAGSTYGYVYNKSGQDYFAAPQTNSSVLWRNTSDGFFLIKGLPGVFYGSVAWGDYDGDGLPDILLTGIGFLGAPFGTLGTPITQVWRNTGNGFTNINAGLPGVVYGSAVWGDYDNDGHLDILLTGATNLNYPSGIFGFDLGPFESTDYSTPVTGLPSGFITQIWRNTGNGFSNINAGLPGVWTGAAAWGDYDNDGRLDVLLTGATNSTILYGNDGTYDFDIAEPAGFISQIWRNTGAGFSNINAGLTGMAFSSAAWGDYDNDGRLDIVLAGATAIDTNGNVTAMVSQILRNNTLVANTPPAAPTGLNASLSGSSVVFSWNAATDGQTPASGLTYNLRAGTTPGGFDLISPMAAGNGQRRVVQMGNAQESLSRTIKGLPLGQPIYWSVQAIDTAFAGSAFAPEQTFTFNSVFTPSNGTPIPGDLNGDGIVDQNELASVLANLNGNGMVSDSELSLVLSDYWPYSPWLRMTNTAGLGGTNVSFQISSNPITTAFSVQYSTNLSNWINLGQAVPRYSFTDTNAPALPQRYYRLRFP